MCNWKAFFRADGFRSAFLILPKPMFRTPTEKRWGPHPTPGPYPTPDTSEQGKNWSGRGPWTYLPSAPNIHVPLGLHAQPRPHPNLHGAPFPPAVGNGTVSHEAGPVPRAGCCRRRLRPPSAQGHLDRLCQHRPVGEVVPPTAGTDGASPGRR